MRVTILTLGTRGDVQPFLAFGLGLERAGHQVQLATHDKYESIVRNARMAFRPLAEGRVSEGAATPEGRWWMEKGSRRLPPWVGYLRDARSVARRRLADALAACADADAIVASDLATLLGWQMSEHYGSSLVSARLNPPMPIATRAPAGAARRVRQALWRSARPWLNAVRRDVGLAPLPVAEPMTELDRRRTLVLYAWSSCVMPKPARVGDRGQVTGYWFLDDGVDPDPPPGLDEFLSAGPPPVCIAFGNMLDTDRARCTEVSVAAVRSAGHRGVVIGGVGGSVSGAGRSGPIFSVDTVAHSWLFERCAAVVHTGGAGTAAAALRAGLPAVPVPQMDHQFLWSRRLAELGAGTAPIPRRRLSVENLRPAILAAAADVTMRHRAAALGQRIRTEDGVARAVEAFEAYVGRAGRREPGSVIRYASVLRQ